MRILSVFMLSLSMLACGGKSQGPSAPAPAPEPKAACCDPKQNPGGIEGSHCCADGTWRGDIGNGGSEECAELGGDGTICPE
jgi:hypothetical protein